jgi:glutathione peroxidase
MLKLWGRTNSINVQKVVWALEEMNVPYSRTEAGMEHGVVNTPEYLRMNPNARVPTIDDDGFVLYEGEPVGLDGRGSGLTPQYGGLVKLQQDYAARGFTVIGTPCNQFLGQEPGSASEIASFCAMTYGVDFPLLEKADVNGADRSPLYRFLVDSPAGGGERIGWNFEKFLVGRDGAVKARFSPRTEPGDRAITAAIEGALAP